MTYHAIAQLCSSQARVALYKIEHARAIGATEPLTCERHVHAWSAVVAAPSQSDRGPSLSLRCLMIEEGPQSTATATATATGTGSCIDCLIFYF